MNLEDVIAAGLRHQTINTLERRPSADTYAQNIIRLENQLQGHTDDNEYHVLLPFYNSGMHCYERKNLQEAEQAGEAGCTRIVSILTTGLFAYHAAGTGHPLFIIGTGISAGYTLYTFFRKDTLDVQNQNEPLPTLTPELAIEFVQKNAQAIREVIHEYNNALTQRIRQNT